MKVKNPLSENATKGDLLILKGDLEYKLSELEHRVDEKAKQYRDEILTSNDKLAKTLETIREDIEIGNFQTGEKVKDHEERIKHLENPPAGGQQTA